MKSTNKKSHKRDWSFYAIIISLIVIAIPVSVLGYLSISAAMGKGAPIFGNRFTNDHDPQITEEHVTTIHENVSKLEGVLEAKVELKSATMRVYLLVDESSKEETITKLLTVAYEAVIDVLDVDTYFSTLGIQKQYDLEIHGFNMATVNEETQSAYVYGLLNKNANMLEPKTQMLTTPQSQEIVDYFYKVEKERDEALNTPVTEEPETTEGDDEGE